MKAMILLSGGIDSTVMLAIAHQQGKECIALSFDYGQRHRIELESAKAIASHYGVEHHIISLNHEAFNVSSLVDHNVKVPSNRTAEEIASTGIPSTYVPARNTIFIAYALGFAEITSAEEIHFGANAMDVNPYPDTRPEYFAAFQSVINVATKQAVEGKSPRLVTPLINWDKTKIIAEGLHLKAPLHLTLSCYNPHENGSVCNQCDACILRKEGFERNSWR